MHNMNKTRFEGYEFEDSAGRAPPPPARARARPRSARSAGHLPPRRDRDRDRGPREHRGALGEAPDPPRERARSPPARAPARARMRKIPPPERITEAARSSALRAAWDTNPITPLPTRSAWQATPDISSLMRSARKDRSSPHASSSARARANRVRALAPRRAHLLAVGRHQRHGVHGRHRARVDRLEAEARRGARRAERHGAGGERHRGELGGGHCVCVRGEVWVC